MAAGPHFHILAFAALGQGVSGGDKIFIECARSWSEAGHRVTIHGTEHAREMALSHGLKSVEFHVIEMGDWYDKSFALHYLLKTWKACRWAWKWSPHRDSPQDQIHFWSAGDSPPDVLPAWILKRRHTAVRWNAAFYFFAAPPWRSRRDEAYRGGRLPVSLRSAVYFLFQQITYPLILGKSDAIVVCNHLDVQRMTEDGGKTEKILAIYGGVDLLGARAVPEPAEKKYAGCFVGRFHIQKGVLSLIRIWRQVVNRLPSARLAIIGEGSLRKEMEELIRTLSLTANVEILGYLDGVPKYEVMKASRVFLHTPTHDTGGMAAAEAMACDLPVVGYDLPGYRFCYPEVMVKAPIGDEPGFANRVVELLEDSSRHREYADRSRNFVENWAWPQRAAQIKSHFLASE
jgi:glycosyltransferase involved in cell wall biosynthesis